MYSLCPGVVCRALLGIVRCQSCLLLVLSPKCTFCASFLLKSAQFLSRKLFFCCFLHKKTSKNENGPVCCISVCYVHCDHSFLCKIHAIANRNAKSQRADNQKDMPIFFAFLQFCKFLVSKQTNRGDGLHLIKLTNIG